MLKRVGTMMMVGVLGISPAYAEESPSGFLSDYPALEADPDRKGAMRYVSPTWDRKAYDRVMIDEISIFYHPDSKYKGIEPSQMMALSDGFRAILTEELEPAIPVVERSGKGVMRVRIAVTDVKAKKKKKGFLAYTPIGLVATGAKAIAGKNAPKFSLNDASFEVELVDSSNDQRLGVLVDKAPESDKKESVEDASWEAIEQSLRFYAKRFRARMEAP